MNKHARRRARTPIAGRLIRFSLPLIFSGILQQLYSWADAFIVGNIVGEAALAAIGATGTIVNLYLMAITGFTTGLSIVFAQQFGGGETEDMAPLLALFSKLLGAAFTVLAAAGMVITAPLLRALHTTADTMDMACTYLRLIFLGVPFLAVYNAYAAALRGVGDSRAPLWAVVVSAAVNVALDIALVAWLPLGVAGAAWATVISQAVMAGFIVAYSARRHALLRFSLRARNWNARLLRHGTRLGVPAMLQSSISAIGGLALQNLMNGFGTQTVAAITTAYRVDSIVLLPILNIGAGLSTLTAHSYGAGEGRRTRRLLEVGTVLTAAISLVMTALVMTCGGYLIAIFGVSAQATEIGWQFFQRIGWFYGIFGLATAARGYLEGLGDVLYTSMAGVAALAVRIGVSYALAGAWGNRVIAYAEAISWGVLLVLCWGRTAAKGSALTAL